MKTTLTTEQSRHLIGLGAPKEKASGGELYSDPSSWIKRTIPTFRLEDFLNGEILPKDLDEDDIKYHLRMEDYYGDWIVGHYNLGIPYYVDKVFTAEELIDALYQLACWYYGEYLKSEEK